MTIILKRVRFTKLISTDIIVRLNISNEILLPVSGLEPEPRLGQGFKPCTSTNFVMQALATWNVRLTSD